jgi:hypothetical protein
LRDTRVIIWGNFEDLGNPTTLARQLLVNIPIPLTQILADWLRAKKTNKPAGLLVTLNSKEAVSILLENASTLMEDCSMIQGVSKDKPVAERHVLNSSYNLNVFQDPKLRKNAVVALSILNSAETSNNLQTRTTPKPTWNLSRNLRARATLQRSGTCDSSGPNDNTPRPEAEAEISNTLGVLSVDASEMTVDPTLSFPDDVSFYGSTHEEFEPALMPQNCIASVGALIKPQLYGPGEGILGPPLHITTTPKRIPDYFRKTRPRKPPNINAQHSLPKARNQKALDHLSESTQTRLSHLYSISTSGPQTSYLNNPLLNILVHSLLTTLTRNCNEVFVHQLPQVTQ